MTRTLEILRNYFDPEAVGSKYLEVVRFTQYRRTDQTIDEYIAKFNLLWREAESKMEMGAGFPEQFTSFRARGLRGYLLKQSRRCWPAARRACSLRKWRRICEDYPRLPAERPARVP